MKNLIQIFGSFINHRRSNSANVAGAKDFEKAIAMIVFPAVLWGVGTIVSFIPFVGFFGVLWKGATIVGHLFVGWIYWPFLFFYIINLIIQWSWFNKALRLRIINAQKPKTQRTKLIQRILMRGLRQVEYVKFRQHTIYLATILGLVFSYNFTARVDYWLSGSPTAFMYYKDLPIIGTKHALYETLQEGMMASPEVTDRVKRWCDLELFPWDICLQLERFPSFDWSNRGSWKPQMDSHLKEKLNQAFGA